MSAASLSVSGDSSSSHSVPLAFEASVPPASAVSVLPRSTASVPPALEASVLPASTASVPPASEASVPPVRIRFTTADDILLLREVAGHEQPFALVLSNLS